MTGVPNQLAGFLGDPGQSSQFELLRVAKEAETAEENNGVHSGTTEEIKLFLDRC